MKQIQLDWSSLVFQVKIIEKYFEEFRTLKKNTLQGT